ncbi:MAG: hypothetical protein ACRDYV_12375, partial [Acidimicrobiia bacterium]
MTGAPIYLVAGEDPTLRTEALHRLLPDLLGDDDPSLALEDFSLAPRVGEGDADDGPDTRPPVLSAALSAASTPPFGASRRIIVLREMGALNAADAEALARWLADPLE